eukprot:scaffold267223_cov27-Tisochrysis_lutea.AAC.4
MQGHARGEIVRKFFFHVPYSCLAPHPLPFGRGTTAFTIGLGGGLHARYHAVLERPRIRYAYCTESARPLCLRRPWSSNTTTTLNTSISTQVTRGIKRTSVRLHSSKWRSCPPAP